MPVMWPSAIRCSWDCGCSSFFAGGMGTCGYDRLSSSDGRLWNTLTVRTLTEHSCLLPTAAPRPRDTPHLIRGARGTVLLCQLRTVACYLFP